MQLGLERAAATRLPELDGARFALLANMGSVDTDFRYAWDVLGEAYPKQLAAIFSPQHGLWGEQQANMIESGHSRLPHLNLPVHSLYADRREPTDGMFEGIEALVIDLQDVGTRVYTFNWTAMNCLAVCARKGIPVVLLDRPNPLGGIQAEGPLLDLEYRSFVGQASIPMRHGLTMGELLRLINEETAIGADLRVIPVGGWKREMIWPATGRAWIPPSPNVPRFEGVLAYPGQVLLEGTNLSEGRGTTTPFEWFGAPFIDPDRLAGELTQLNLPGVAIRPVQFIPTFDKWRGQTCGGVVFRVTDPHAFQPYRTAIAQLAICQRDWPDDFAWIDPPYEYESEKMPIDIIDGSSRLREGLARQGASADISEIVDEITRFDEAAWWERARPYMLYE